MLVGVLRHVGAEEGEDENVGAAGMSLTDEEEGLVAGEVRAVQGEEGGSEVPGGKGRSRIVTQIY